MWGCILHAARGFRRSAGYQQQAQGTVYNAHIYDAHTYDAHLGTISYVKAGDTFILTFDGTPTGHTPCLKMVPQVTSDILAIALFEIPN